MLNPSLSSLQSSLRMLAVYSFYFFLLLSFPLLHLFCTLASSDCCIYFFCSIEEIRNRHDVIRRITDKISRYERELSKPGSHPVRDGIVDLRLLCRTNFPHELVFFLSSPSLSSLNHILVLEASGSFISDPCLINVISSSLP